MPGTAALAQTSKAPRSDRSIWRYAAGSDGAPCRFRRQVRTLRRRVSAAGWEPPSPADMSLPISLSFERRATRTSTRRSMRGRSASGSLSVRDRLVESNAPSTGTNAPLILVADDVAANVELLFDQLHVLGFRAIAASDGPSALAMCFERRPDLCILDVSMPAGDLGVDDRSTGLEVCRRIKRHPRTKSIPVIFVTALNDTTDRVKAIEAGGDDFLTKPHNRLVLGARVRSLVKLKAAAE